MLNQDKQDSKNLYILGKIRGPFIKLGFFIATLIIFYLLYSISYANRIYPNTKIGSINFGGLTKEKATALLNQKIKENKGQNIELVLDNKKEKILYSDLKIQYDPERTVDVLFNWTHRKSIVENIKQRLLILAKPKIFVSFYSYDKNYLDKKINLVKNNLERRVIDASIIVENGRAEITNEQTGKSINDEDFIVELLQQIGYLENINNFNLQISNVSPILFSKDLSIDKENIDKIIDRKITLKSSVGEYTLDSYIIGDWLDFGAVYNKDLNRYYLFYEFNQDKIRQYFKDLAKKINKDPVDAKLTVSNGKVTTFQDSQTGISLNEVKSLTTLEENLSNIILSLNSSANNLIDTVEITVDVTSPAITGSQIENLGLKELISTGKTNFKGSPENRKSNIKIGAEIINGSLIKQGDTFSFLNTLGEISESRGFKKELVIKADKTEPEVGGGLCQVSTTVFRAALNAGLKITERTNHKYRVSYYEPPVGLDATIYDPAPDLKFLNDTPGYILIQARVEGTNLIFDFYGTKDGRDVTISTPELYDYVNPADPVYIDDPTLAPGEEKYKEKAHQGVKARVTYTVKKNGVEFIKQTFNSTYVPWQAVILRGPAIPESSNQTVSKPLPVEALTPTPTSSPTPELTPTPTSTPTPTPSEVPTPSPSLTST